MGDVSEVIGKHPKPVREERGQVTTVMGQHCHVCGAMFPPQWWAEMGLQPRLGCLRCRFADIVHGYYQEQPDNQYVSLVQNSLTQQTLSSAARYAHMINPSSPHNTLEGP